MSSLLRPSFFYLYFSCNDRENELLPSSPPPPPPSSLSLSLSQVSDKTEVGLMTTYNLQTSNVSLGLAGKYVTEDGATLRVGRDRELLIRVLLYPKRGRNSW